MENNNDKLAQIINYLNSMEKELSERIGRIEKHLGLAKSAQPVLSIPNHADAPKSEPQPALVAQTSVGEISSIESKIGAKYLNWIGVIALVFGVGFFLKYAFDNDWVGPTGRVMIGIFLGLFFIMGGHLSAVKNYRLPAWGLMGCGLSILYLSIFAAFQFYSLIGQVPSFGFMILITVTGITLSVRYNALPISVLALLGGFLTPLLMSTGHDNQVGLFSYIALLNLGIFATSYFKKWRSLDYLAFFCTVIMFFGWYFRYYVEAKLFPTIFFLSVFFVIFAFLAFFHNIIHRKKTNMADLFLLLGTPAFYFGTAYGLLHAKFSGYMGLSALVMVAIYMGLVRVAQLRNKDDKYLLSILLGIALTFLTLTVPIQLNHKWITIAWAVQAVILVWVSFNTKSLITRLGGLVALFLVIIRLAVFESFNVHPEAFRAVFNERLLTFLIALIGFLFAGYIYGKKKDAYPLESAIVRPALAIISAVLGFWMITMETMAYYDYCLPANFPGSSMQRALSVAWTVYALVLMIIGILKKYSLVRWLSFSVFGVTIIKVFLFDLSSLEPIYRITSFVVLGAILMGVSFLYQRLKKRLQ